MDATGQSGPPALTEALDRLWTRFRPEIEQRLGIIEAAAAALAGDSLTGAQLTSAQREAAYAAAHKLAGVLGTFGLAEGTALARELEHRFAPETASDPASAEEMVRAAARMRALVENRG
jgi:HPt (histidine-containing phosphotransfer) domain-containing protein